MEIENDDEERAVAAILLACALEQTPGKPRKKRSCWTKPWLRQREEKSIYSGLVCELKLADKGDYRRFLRMNPDAFEVSHFHRNQNSFISFC